MDTYAVLDPELERRATTEGWTLHTEWAGGPARFFYVGGEPPWESFQVSIDPPQDGIVTIVARSVDTNDHREFEQAWHGSFAEFDSLLTSALATVDAWRRRAQ